MLSASPLTDRKISPPQVGLVYLAHPNGTNGGLYGRPPVRPNAHITVRWEIPAAIVDGYGRPCRPTGKDQEPQNLVVGLFRLGVASNTAGIISKRLFDRPPIASRPAKKTLVGSTPFYAPKSVSLRLCKQAVASKRRVGNKRVVSCLFEAAFCNEVEWTFSNSPSRECNLNLGCFHYLRA